MDQSQQIQTLLSDTQQQSQQQTQQQIDNAIAKLQPQVEQVVLISTLLTVVIVLIMLINAMYKWRVERAILRMDKNLEKLILVQAPGDKKPDKISTGLSEQN